MPYIRITLHRFPDSPDPAVVSPAEITARLQVGITDLMERVLHKERSLTVVSVSSDSAGQWSAGGYALTGANAAVQAFITAGSNRPEEKADFIAACHALLVDALGPLAGPAYVVVQEVPAQDWGYDGLSQAARRQQRGQQP